MKNALLILFFLFSFTAYSQQDSVRLSKISVGAVYSPDYCFRILHFPSSSQWVKEIRNAEEMPMFGFSAGLGLNYKLNSKIGLETGAYYTIRGEQTKKTELTWVSPDPAFPDKSRTKFKYTIIEFPLKINYYLKKGKLSYAVSLGISANVFSEKNSKVILEYGDGHKTKAVSNVNIGYRKFNSAILIGVELNYQLIERVAFRFNPVYRQNITSILIDGKSKEYPYSIGVAVGVYYTFKKRYTK
jgi:hypothetical protein